MEELQILFDTGKFEELLDQTAESSDSNVLFLRARSYIAIGDLDAATEIFQNAVALSGIWLDCLEHFITFQKEMGQYIANRMKKHLEQDHISI